MDNTTGSKPNPQPNAGATPPKPAQPAQPAQPGAHAAAPAQPPKPAQPAQPPRSAQPAQPSPGQQGAGAPSGASQGAQAGSTAQQPAKSATQMGSETKHDLGSQAKSAVAAGKNRAVDALGGVAQSLQASAKQMNDQQQNAVGHYVDRAGQQVQQLADYLKNNDAGQIADQTEEFARRKPAVFLAGAFAIGLVGARFLKSSRRKERHDQQNDSAGLHLNSSASRNSSAHRSTPTLDRERMMPGAGSAGPADTWRNEPTAGAGMGGSFGGTGATGATGTPGTSSAAGSTGATTPGTTPPGGAERR